MSLSTMRIPAFKSIISEHMESVHDEIVKIMEEVDSGEQKLSKRRTQLTEIDEEIHEAENFIKACESTEIFGNLDVGKELLIKYRSSIVSLTTAQSFRSFIKNNRDTLIKKIDYRKCKICQLSAHRDAMDALLDGDFQLHERLLFTKARYIKKAKKISIVGQGLSVNGKKLKEEYYTKLSTLSHDISKISIGVYIHPM